MNKNKLTEDILKSVYSYYTNGRNYIKESLDEDGYSVVLDDKIYNDLIDQISNGIYQEMEKGHYLIPTLNGFTFNLMYDGDCYMDDERGNEYEVQISEEQLDNLMNMVSSDGNMVAEGKFNAFSKVEQDGPFRKYTKKPDISDEIANQEIENAENRHDQREMDREDAGEDFLETSLEDRFNDTDHRNASSEYWNGRYSNMAEPHGYGTSGTMSMNMDEESKGDMAHYASKGQGYIHENNYKNINRNMKKLQLNESQLTRLISEMTKRVLNEMGDIDDINNMNGVDDMGGKNYYSDLQAFRDRHEDHDDYFEGGEEEPTDDNMPIGDNTPSDIPMGDFEDETPEEDELSNMLENKRRKDEKDNQETLIKFITENWDNHANNLLK